VAGSSERGNYPSGSIKCSEFFAERLVSCQGLCSSHLICRWVFVCVSVYVPRYHVSMLVCICLSVSYLTMLY
jgi:hypothetical protein